MRDANSQHRFKRRRDRSRGAYPLSRIVGALSGPIQAQRQSGSLSSIVTGTIAGGGTFAGLLNITQFTVRNGAVVGVGTLTGTLTDALGNVIGTVTGVPITIPVSSLQGSCTILTLTLGPLDLNLLGLMVHLNQVVLNITAQQAPGNLLGNLLCAIAHLLDSNAAPNGLLQSIASLLNQILAAL